MSGTRLVVLILGGYGTFGGRLAGLLADDERLTLLIAGRSHERADAFCRRLGGRARAVPVALDRRDVATRLGDLSPDILVDATGPFQAYGPVPYGVVEACLAGGVHYADLADGAGFVDGIGQFDASAKSRGIFVLSGMSSFPVLTAAVVDDLALGLDRLVSVTAGVAPSPYAGVGRNVIAAIAGYAGQPLRLRRGGGEMVAHALTESLDYTVAPPGRIPLRTTRFSLVDVPDLQVLPRRRPTLSDVWMGAGPVPETLHRALNGLSWLVRLRILPSLSALAPLIERVNAVLRWGEHRGGMFVSVTGLDRTGHAVERSWHMIADGEDGPLIPSMAVEAIVRKALCGDWPRPGARAGDGELDLADYRALFARRAIHTGYRRSEDEAPGRSLFRRVLGDAWDALPEAVRALHDGTGQRTYRGRATVERGAAAAARVAARLFGLPPAGGDVPVELRFTVHDRDTDAPRETWRRDFGGRTFDSVLREGRGRWSRLLLERFGPVTVGLALVVEDRRLRLVVRRWSFLGIPMPRALAPAGDASETDAEGRFAFDVEIAHPWIGRIVRYKGWLDPMDPASSTADAQTAAVTPHATHEHSANASGH